MKSFDIHAATHALVIALIATGCNDDDDPGPRTPVISDIAELTASTPSGSAFAIYRENAPDIMLNAPGAQVDISRIKIGESLMVTYTMADGGEAGRSGDINLHSYYAINNSTLIKGDIADFPDWNKEEVYLISIWRAGNKIDLRCRLTYDPAPRTFIMLLDESTAGNPVPDLYLVHQLQQPVESFDRNYYAAFDMGDLWEQTTCEGVAVHIANSNLQQQVYRFMK